MSGPYKNYSNYPNGLGDGVVIRGVPLAMAFPGDVYWVDSGAARTGQGTWKQPDATLSAALGRVTSANGDIIFLKPGHAETLTATLTPDAVATKHGFAIVGLGHGDARPTFTNGLSGTDDAFDFAGNNILVHNIKWAEAASGTTITVFNVSGNWFTLSGCYIELGAKTKKALTFDTTAKKHLGCYNNVVVGTAAGCTHGFEIEKTHLYAEFIGNKFMVMQSTGIDTGCIVNTSGSTNAGCFVIKDNIALGLSTTDPLILQTKTPGHSLAINNVICGTDATLNLGASPAGGVAFFWNWTLEQGKGLPAALDIQGVRPINTTPAS